MIQSSLFRACAGAVAGLLALSCGGSTPFSNNPLPTPAPTPLPAPTPPPDPIALSCPIGMGYATTTCQRGTAKLGEPVYAAIDKLIKDKPSIFNLEDEAGAGQFKVLDTEAFFTGVVNNIRAAGLCAERTLDLQRIVLKINNDYSEEWTVLNNRDFINRNGYTTTCEPASFPVTPEDLVSFIWVGIFAFECDAGVTHPPAQEKTIPMGCDVYVTATPKLLNRTDVPDWIHGADVKWTVRYGEDLVSVDEDFRYNNDFNKFVRALKPGDFSLCATVLGKTGCMNATIIPTP